MFKIYTWSDSNNMIKKSWDILNINFFINLFIQFFHISIKILKNSLAKYYQNKKRKTAKKKKKKKFHEKHQCISEELKTKSDNMVAIDIKIAYKMKNKN